MLRAYEVAVLTGGGFGFELSAAVVPDVADDDLDHAGNRYGQEGAEDAGQFDRDQDRNDQSTGSA